MCQHMLTRAGTCCHETAEQEVTPWRQAHLLEQKEGLRDSLIAPIPMIIQSDHLQLHKDDELTCPSMPIISALRKTDKANHRRVSGPQHIL